MSRVLTALARLDEKQRAEYWAALALRRSKGLGPRSICRLLHYFGSAYTAVHNVSRWKEAGLTVRHSAEIRAGVWRDTARPEWEDSRDLDGHILLWTDPRYPSLLRELPDAPALLYCRGNMDLLGRPCVAVVGSRACSQEAITLARTIARGLSGCGICVVSGLARGIDRAAHTGALSAVGGSIAVLGTGVDVIYPFENEDLYDTLASQGLLVSEFPPGTRPSGYHFPIRNRIISGICLGVLVVEASPRSGSLITARHALEQNRAVYAVPPSGWTVQTDGKPASGCASLLDQGARLAHTALDIVADLSPQLRAFSFCGVPPRTPSGEMISPEPPHSPVSAPAATAPKENPPPSAAAPDLDSPEGRVLTLLRQGGPQHPDRLAENLPPAEAEPGVLGALLILLEVRGLVRCLPGSVYEIC